MSVFVLHDFSGFPYIRLPAYPIDFSAAVVIVAIVCRSCHSIAGPCATGRRCVSLPHGERTSFTHFQTCAAERSKDKERSDARPKEACRRYRRNRNAEIQPNHNRVRIGKELPVAAEGAVCCLSIYLLLLVLATDAAAQTNMGTVVLGSSSNSPTAVTVPITVTGTVNAVAVVTQGAASKDFVVGSGGSCAGGTFSSLPASCTVNVTFAPKFSGARLARWCFIAAAMACWERPT